MQIAVILGGSGYIGGFILREFLSRGMFDHYVVWDIRELKGFDSEIESGKVQYSKVDVRKPLPSLAPGFNAKKSWIYNLAAVHREPGHDFREYFDTNIPGAQHAVELARRTGISNIFFTSSIAPYGRSMEQRTESSPLYPETGYGISKALAEKIHQVWLAQEPERRLIIVRPSVIYGPGDPGNVYRMIRAIRKGTFIIPGTGNYIKAYGYVYGLVDSIRFAMALEDRFVLYNYAENPLLPLKGMVEEVKRELQIKRKVLRLPLWFLKGLAGILSVLMKLIGKKTEIHPVRVKKAAFPTNIKPEFLINNGFEFKYDFSSSLKHWRRIRKEDFD